MAGGTFTISNGGVFGSLMGTPIINLPQTGVLGLHATKDKPVAINGKVEIRPVRFSFPLSFPLLSLESHFCCWLTVPLSYTLDDVPGTHIRSPPFGWQRSGDILGQGEGIHRRSASDADRLTDHPRTERILLAVLGNQRLAIDAPRLPLS